MLLANGIILNPANPNTAKLGSINVLNDEILKLIMAYITTFKKLQLILLNIWEQWLIYYLSEHFKK